MRHRSRVSTQCTSMRHVHFEKSITRVAFSPTFLKANVKAKYDLLHGYKIKLDLKETALLCSHRRDVTLYSTTTLRLIRQLVS